MQFESKPESAYDSDSSFDTDSEDGRAGRQQNDDDPMVEYEDEFGRMRTARQSEVPRHLLHKEEEVDPDESVVISFGTVTLVYLRASAGILLFGIRCTTTRRTSPRRNELRRSRKRWRKRINR